MSKTPWIVARNNFVFECLRCGSTYQPNLPATIPMVVAMSDQFVKEHRECPSLLERVADLRDGFEQAVGREGFDRAAWMATVDALKRQAGRYPASEQKAGSEALERLAARIATA